MSIGAELARVLASSWPTFFGDISMATGKATLCPCPGRRSCATSCRAGPPRSAGIWIPARPADSSGLPTTRVEIATAPSARPWPRPDGSRPALIAFCGCHIFTWSSRCRPICASFAARAQPSCRHLAQGRRRSHRDLGSRSQVARRQGPAGGHGRPAHLDSAARVSPPRPLHRHRWWVCARWKPQGRRQARLPLSRARPRGPLSRQVPRSPRERHSRWRPSRRPVGPRGPSSKLESRCHRSRLRHGRRIPSTLRPVSATAR